MPQPSCQSQSLQPEAAFHMGVQEAARSCSAAAHRLTLRVTSQSLSPPPVAGPGPALPGPVKERERACRLSGNPCGDKKSPLSRASPEAASCALACSKSPASAASADTLRSTPWCAVALPAVCCVRGLKAELLFRAAALLPCIGMPPCPMLPPPMFQEGFSPSRELLLATGATGELPDGVCSLSFSSCIAAGH